MDAAALLAAIVESSSDAIVGKSLDGTVLTWNAAAERIFGYPAAEIVGQSIRLIIPPDRQAEEDAILAAIARGERVDTFETIRCRKDGSKVAVAVTVSPVHDSSGKVVAASKIARDITETKANRHALDDRERRIGQLMLEINHRSRNMLAMIQSMARRSVNQAGRSKADFVARLEQRIRGLAANQELLMRRSWAPVPLAELVDVQLAVLGPALARVRLVPAEVLVTTSAAETIGMALHELAMNALRHGALSGPAGYVDLVWRRLSEDDPDFPGGLEMHWRESGGPPVGAVRERGFGNLLITDMLRTKLQAEVMVDYAPAGFSWSMRSPRAGVVA